MTQHTLSSEAGAASFSLTQQDLGSLLHSNVWTLWSDYRSITVFWRDLYLNINVFLPELPSPAEAEETLDLYGWIIGGAGTTPGPRYHTIVSSPDFFPLLLVLFYFQRKVCWLLCYFMKLSVLFDFPKNDFWQPSSHPTKVWGSTRKHEW